MINSFKRKIDINEVFSLGYEEQHNYLSSFKIPTDEIERSFFQYKCQQYKKSVLKKVLLNIISFFIFFGLLFFLVLKGIYKKIKLDKHESIFPYKDKYGEIIPLSYKTLYEIYEIYYQRGLERSILQKSDLRFIFDIYKRYPLNYFFLSNILYRISFYSFIIKKYRPKIIFCSAEYSFSSSILTKYCNIHGIEHFNVMHGEKIFSITDSFVKFNRFLVWDEHYKDLFLSLRAYPEQFEICFPPSLKLNLNYKKDILYDFTYYLGGEKENQLEKISYLISLLLDKGFKINLRVHPRYSDLEIINKIFKNVPIENASSISLKESFEVTENIIAFYSTVLYQGLVNGKNVFIDDLTCDPDFLKKLKELKYNVFTEKVYWMSKEFPEIRI